MSVLSKALQIAVLVSVCGGCASNSSKSWSAARDGAEPVADTATNVEDTAFRPDAGFQLEPQTERASADAIAPQITQLAASSDVGLDIAIERGQGYSKVYITSPDGSAPAYQVSSMSEPPRLVLDLHGNYAARSRLLPVENSEYVRDIRIGSHADKTRVVFDLTEKAADEQLVARSVDLEEGKLAVLLGSQESAAVIASSETTDYGSDTTFASASDPIAAIPASEVAAPIVAQAPIEVATVEAIQFTKTENSSGQVAVKVSGKAPYELQQTAPSEYLLTINNATALEDARLPQLAAPGKAGIRSTRTIQDGSDVVVRMFVDQGVELRAFNRDNQIVVVSQSPKISTIAADARAQLQDSTADDAQEPVQVEDGDETARRNPTGIPSADGSKIYTGRLISLDLQETDIDNALRIIAEVSNLNIIASDDVAGKVTLRLVDVPWDQALDVILKTNGLDQVTEGNVIRIAPVDKLRQEREALREAKKAAENLEDLRINYVRVSYARANELKEQVESVLSERGSVAVDDRTNQLIIKDIQKGQESATALLKKLDLRTPQVLLETQIVEATRSLLRDLGFQWNYSLSQSPATGNATGQNFPNSIVSGGSANSGTGQQAVNFPASIGLTAGSAISAVLDSADGSRFLAMRLSALEREGKVKVVSRPQIATINNKEAEIKSVETIRIRLPDSGLSVATGQGASAAGGGANAFQEIDVGITLRVTPQASPDYYVLLDVFAKSSTLGSETVDDIPSTIDRQTTSTILVKSGQTFALGGVYRVDERDLMEGVPFLKDIPVLGVFFRRSLADKGDDELIFFITPHIVEGSFDPSLM